MREGSSATPLIALDAIVIDTETTGLDPRKARLIEFAGAPLVAGAIEPSRSFRALVNPGEPIPVEATRVHGIDDKAVANAPDFKTAWPDIANALGKSIVIGHTLGFDLAVLKRECERANLQWRRPRTLDTRLLAEVAEPNLAGYSLEDLAAWLGVETHGRHSALGDAAIAGNVFVALVPRLREHGIRTLGEAETACRALIDVLDDQLRAGWVEAIEAPRRVEGERMLFRIDTQPFRHRVSEVMSTAQYAAHGTPLSEIVRQLAEQRMSSLFVSHTSANPDKPRPETVGIVTERDVLRAIATHGAAALDRPAEHFAMHPLFTVPDDAFLYRALARMNRLNIRHLGVTDAHGIVTGAISSRDLLQSRAEEAIWLGDEIDQAVNAKGLAAAWSRLPLVAEGLLSEDMAGRDIAGIVSRELGALTRRAGVLAEQSMRKEGDGEPPCAYALAVLGSGGRDESLLALDQDNALIFEEGAPGGAADRWFAKFGTIVADILHEAGVPYCKGGVMAKDAKWRGSLLTWRDRIADWIRRSKPDDLLSVDIFFDLRGVHGEPSLAAGLRADAFMLAAGEVEFAKLLAESAGTTDAALTFLGGIKTVNGRIDLKKSGLFGIVTMARVLAIRHNLAERTTPARLSAINALGIGGKTDLDRLDAAQATFLDLILKQQIRDIQIGLPPNNAVAVKELSRKDRERLLDALKAVRHLDDLTKELLFRA